jgi:hypothetical protein
LTDIDTGVEPVLSLIEWSGRVGGLSILFDHRQPFRVEASRSHDAMGAGYLLATCQKN